MDSHAFTDEDLTAYLDGEADDTLSARVESARAEPEVAARLASLGLSMDHIAAAGELALGDAPAMPELPVMAESSGRGWVGWAAAVAVGAIIGTTFTMFAQPKRDWVDEVASYQALYVAETLALAPQPRAVADVVIAEFGKATGLDMSGATALDGAIFARAQMLGLDGEPLLQMVFALADGTPMALCVMPIGEEDSALETDAAEGLAFTRWTDDGFGFVIIGGDSGKDTAQLAEQARAQLSL